ncbi:MAG: saccharopine dehydrogenase, partial [Paracoccaceae bacterium]
QKSGGICPPVTSFPNQKALIDALSGAIEPITAPIPNAIVIGALGRVGTGAADLCKALGIPVTKWDMAETASGGPFPEILYHSLFFNCILARPGTPVFVSPQMVNHDRALCVIGDIACDPDSDYNPIPLYDKATSWDAPAFRVVSEPPLDVMAIDNLPSLLPLESSEDFAAQLLPYLLELDNLEKDVWGRAKTTFDQHIKEV